MNGDEIKFSPIVARGNNKSILNFLHILLIYKALYGEEKFKEFLEAIDKDMKKKDLCIAAGISHASMAKLGKNENVTTDVLVKICTALQCDIGDIIELTNDKK